VAAGSDGIDSDARAGGPDRAVAQAGFGHRRLEQERSVRDLGEERHEHVEQQVAHAVDDRAAGMELCL